MYMAFRMNYRYIRGTPQSQQEVRIERTKRGIKRRQRHDAQRRHANIRNWVGYCASEQELAYVSICYSLSGGRVYTQQKTDLCLTSGTAITATSHPEQIPLFFCVYFAFFFILYIFLSILIYFFFPFYVFYYIKDLPVPLSLNLLLLGCVGGGGEKGVHVCVFVRNGTRCFQLLGCFVLTPRTKTPPVPAYSIRTQ